MVAESRSTHSISVVVPVYRGAVTLPGLVDELRELTTPHRTPAGEWMRVAEVLLVFDHGPDHSDEVIRELAAAHDFVRPIWLSRNYGQHAATLAGMASSGSDWIVTLDEDGQYDPADIGAFLDVALEQQVSLVYASPRNPAPHGFLRNLASRTAKRVVDLLVGGHEAHRYHSFRLILGEVGRSVAAYAGSGVYLDVALGWVAGDAATAPATLREEGRESGYNLHRLMSHFWRLALTSGTRGLRAVAGAGVLFAFVGVIYAIYLAAHQIVTGRVPEGWTSLMVVILLATGAILFALGVIAEYVGVAVSMAMGRPLYLIVSDPADGPLGRRRGDTEG